MKAIKDLRIVFFGTPEFAVTALQAMINARLQVVAVVTAPDKPAGRGLSLHQTPVKVAALEAGIPVLQPEKLKSPEFLDELKALHADIQVVVAFRMLPELVWNMPPMGTINVHASLLPQYRGAAPINWAIINGEKETGVTTFRLKHEIDTGNLLLQERVPILPEDNAGSLYTKLMHAGAALLVTTLEGLAADQITPFAQPEKLSLAHAPKIFKEDTRINWSRHAIQVHNFIRGMSPYPGAFTLLGDKTLKVFSSHFLAETPNAFEGNYDTDGKSYLRFACIDGWLYLDDVQQEGKKRMGITEFLRGFRV